MQTFEDAIEHTRETGSQPHEDGLHISGGVYAKEFRLKAGMMLISHKHAYDHMSILASGNAILRADGRNHSLTGPTVVEIKAGVEHALYTETDCVWFCLHSLALAEDAEAGGDPFAMDGVTIVKESM